MSENPDAFKRLSRGQTPFQDPIPQWKYHEDNDTALECGEEFQEDLEYVAFELQEI